MAGSMCRHQQMKTLEQIGEREAIRRLSRRLFPAVHEVVGIGDDAAVLCDEGSEFDWVLTSDPVIEGTHFGIDSPNRGIGHKAVGRVLSDLAAMGAEPSWILINLVATPDTPYDKLEEVYEGATELALKYGVAIVGGDLAKGPNLELHVFAVGRLPHNSAVLRSGAREGDLIYVTGSLGGSIKEKHLWFEPRVTEGLWLREQSWPSAMIDLSDGVATDLRHIMEMSKVGAEIQGEHVPISEAAGKMQDKRSALDHALYDGEDFELLFTVPDGKHAFFESAWKEAFELPCVRIGKITDTLETLACVTGKSSRTIISKGGYDHFSE